MRKFWINVNGIGYDVEVEEIGNATYAPAPGTEPVAAAPAAAAAPAPAAPARSATPAVDGTQIKCPMPGTILDVRVGVGDAVKKGDTLMVLEAMKMENEIQVPADGKVAGVYAAKGSSVNAGDLLAVIA
jgi:biotin carboxyl carrier protein